MSRFAVIIRDPSPWQENQLTNFFAANGYGYWHWVNSVWLVTSVAGETATGLRDKVKQIAPEHVLVIEIPDTETTPAWALNGPKEWGDWFRTTWDGSR